MDSTDLSRQTIPSINKIWELTIEQAPEDSERLIKEALAKRIKYLLDHDMNAIMNAFYRLDISEEKVRRVIAISDVDSISDLLAELVIDREKQKILTREKYKTP